MTCEQWAEVEARTEEASDTVASAVSRLGAGARKDKAVLWGLYKLRECLNEIPQLDEIKI
jgi:hypothetical protein